MLTTINLNSAKRYIEDAFGPMATDALSIFPAFFRFTDNTDLQNFVNQTNQICIGNMAVSYSQTNAINALDINLNTLLNVKAYTFKDANITTSKQFTIENLVFTKVAINTQTQISLQFSFTGWIFTTTLT